MRKGERKGGSDIQGRKDAAEALKPWAKGESS